ncbi:hypothetical protein [uncultured Nocardioides sp.]|jgi:hypothetical protein|uniref:hypothetical protein n=1 Tax=uncultured Nocardioides sp. TaxID=198441 RepID=UPI0026123741|nr:hypothetical protein [uncultured Nocardioides sp.]HRD59353.1 hypothetical protein [Nocardioides sp.]
MKRIHTPAEMLTILQRDFGVTYDPDNVRTATSDDDGPPVRVIAQADLDDEADRECDRWERFMERDGRWAS